MNIKHKHNDLKMSKNDTNILNKEFSEGDDQF